MRKPPTPTQAIDVLIGGGKQNGLQKKEKKERNNLKSYRNHYNVIKYKL